MKKKIPDGYQDISLLCVTLFIFLHDLCGKNFLPQRNREKTEVMEKLEFGFWSR